MQREKIGNANINWQEAAFGVGKNRRKTIGFGKCIKKKYECEFFIRELSIVEAGIGCAIWDAAIVMSRWMYENGAALFANQVILELGAGVGLPGILASRYASHVYLTDYMQTLLDNLRYNVTLNTNIDEDEDAPTLQQCKQYMQAHSSVKYLNWDEIAGMPLDLAKDDILPQERLDPIAPQSIDILLGSELTYTACTSTIDNLCKVVDYFLKPGGVFIEILSNDRDGVQLFCKQITLHDYKIQVFDVPERYLGNFKTNQRPESYRFFVFYKSADENAPLVQQACQSFK